jgi:uncharacterized protein
MGPTYCHNASAAPGGIKWESWSDGVFQRAKKENKFVLLDLEAVWCHWCHVMDKQTYNNPEVIKLINSKYIAVKVDQDARPDISHRYEDYGWPATVVLNGSGVDIVKRAGYIRPQDMVSLLNAIIKDPSPEKGDAKPTKFTSEAFLKPALRKELQSRIKANYDNRLDGWNTGNKFLDWDIVEYCMAQAKAGDAQAKKMAQGTLRAQLKLMDPIWGGVYQYSTDNDWAHPHFEKIMSFQAEDMRIYSQAYMFWHNPVYLKAAVDIHKYLKNFLYSPQGAFYTSQDADVIEGQHSAGYFQLSDAQRRKKGMPRIDKHIYARENGWVINALTYLYAASGNKQYLDEATKCAQWVIANRSLPGGGFRHDARDAAGPYLGDTLAMGRAFLGLYAVTADRAWLKKAEQSGDFIAQHFRENDRQAGLVTAEVARHGIQKPEPLYDENVMLARFANLLYHYSGKPLYKQIAQQAMRYLATPEIAKKFSVLVAGPLLADMELSATPTHITIVGSKQDPQAKVLFTGAIGFPAIYKRIEWFDSKEGALPNTEVEFPQLPKAAAFACSGNRCSRPVYRAEDIAPMVERLSE